MFGGRLNSPSTKVSSASISSAKVSEILEEDEEDQIGELVSKISSNKVDAAADLNNKRRTSSSSSNSSASTSTGVMTRCSSIESRRSSETSKGGYWSHRSRYIFHLLTILGSG